MKRSFADIMAGLDSERAQKVARKLPAWAAVDGLEIPSALALEQCSSSATAAYKAFLAGQAAAAAKLRASRYPSQPGGWAPPVHEATGGHGFSAAPPVPAEPCREVLSEAKTPSGVAAECQRDFRKEVEATESPDEVGHAPFIRGSAQRWGFEESDRPVRTILDLTGGLGVDSWALSQVAERVVYFERNEDLAAAAGRNFQRLGAGNIDVRCETVTPQTELPEADLIYADPARRDAAGRKVFLLEDCTPDILTLLPMLLKKAPAVLLKLSPMADLAMLSERLGPALHEIHVVECDGEVKEILCLLLRDNVSPEPDIIVARLNASRGGSSPLQNFALRAHPSQAGAWAPPVHEATGGHGFAGKTSPDVPPRGAGVPPIAADDMQLGADAADGDVLRFRVSEERAAEAVYAAGVQPGEVLLETCPALLKAGAFRLPCARWGLSKLAPSTHLYLATNLPGTKKGQNVPGNQLFDIPGAGTGEIAPGNEKFASPGAETGQFAPGNKYFKAWHVREVLPFGAAAFKALKRRYPRADVTARNLPLGSAELQKRLGVASGGTVHIFGCRLADGSSVLLVTESAK